MDQIAIPSPCYVLDESKLIENLALMKDVQDRSGASIILAFKGFAMWSVFPTIRKYLKGATASSLNEAKLCVEEMGIKAHTYNVAYEDERIDEIVSLSSHLTFNSISQYNRFINRIPKEVSVGLRVNPEWSDVDTDLYNPSSPTSRLGITKNQFPDRLPARIEGLHFHVLCESSAEALVEVLANFEERFGQHISQLKWVNMGGGHLMTRKGYNKELLIETVKTFKARYGVEVILEPGSAVAWETGDLHASVLDLVENGGEKTAIADISFTCHMPDCLEMPYKPRITGAYMDSSKGEYRYRIGGVSCLAGDFMNAYSFDLPLEIGSRLIFEDMIHYTMVKTSTFNGVRHPSIGILREDGTFELVRQFGYEDFKRRLS
jgi:carboxynorspermidine decarboxylase